jgi:hypothetical protein
MPWTNTSALPLLYRLFLHDLCNFQKWTISRKEKSQIAAVLFSESEIGKPLVSSEKMR